MPYNKPNLQPKQFVIYAINRMLDTTYKPTKVDNGWDYNNPTSSQEFKNAYIPITFYDGKFSSEFSTYDENLQIKDNSQYSLTFSVAKYIDNTLNPIFYLLVENRRLRLQTEHKKIDFIITGITPNITKNNVVYSVTCQDTFSYDLSKQNTSITVETETPKNIRELAQLILRTAQLDKKWLVDSQLENNYYADFPSYQKLTQGSKTTTHRMLASLNVSNTTPFNALVELCKKFNATLEVEYSDTETDQGIIYFRNKMTADFSGYHLRDSVNMSAFSVSRKTDNFCSIMHVNGGEDANGQLVSMVPTMPAGVQQYFTMLKPYSVQNDTERYELCKSISYPYAVFEENGVYSLYKRYNNSSYFSKIASSTGERKYRPWTVMTSEEIEHDFQNFPQVYEEDIDGNKTFYQLDATSYFSASINADSDDYFNFLKYRCKSASSFFYDFDYYLNAGIMDQETYDTLQHIFSIDLRNANIILYCISYQYNMLTAKLMSYEDKEEELIAKLCALEEELYTYQVNPDLKPEVVLSVVSDGDDSALSRTTVEAANNEERINVLSSLMNGVWTEEYFNLLFTLKGGDALIERKQEYIEKVKEKTEVFSTYQAEALRILDSKANIGSITFEGYTAPDKGVRIVNSKIYEGTGLVGSFTNLGFEYNLSTKSFSIIGKDNNIDLIAKYNNAVLQKLPTEEKVAWPFVGDSYAGDEYKYLTNGTIVHSATSRDGGGYNAIDMSVYVRESYEDTTCTCYHFMPLIASTLAQRDEYLSESNQTEYVNYCVAKKKYQDALNYITETPHSGDIAEPALSLLTDQPMKRGLYAMTLFYIDELLTKPEYGYTAAKAKYSTPINLLELLTQAQSTQRNLWKNIYTTYNDFIIETNFSDDDQLSSEGLFMAAMETFSKYKNPTYEYSTTVIDTQAIADIRAKDIAINDIVYVYNKNLSSEYTGRIKVTIPRKRIGNFYKIQTISGTYPTRIEYSAPGELKLFSYVDDTTKQVVSEQVIETIPVPKESLEVISNPCKLYCRNQDYKYFLGSSNNTDYYKIITGLQKADALELTISEIQDRGQVIDVYLNCPSVTDASMLMVNRSSIDTLEFFENYSLDTNGVAVPVYTNVLNIEMEERAKPIPLQVTGITQKLREATSQLTVSTDRTMDLVFQRLIKQARL